MKMQNSQPNDSSMTITEKDKSVKKNSTYYVSSSTFNLKPSDLEIDNLLINQIKNMDNAESNKLITQHSNSEAKSIIPHLAVSFASKSMYTNKCSKHPHSKRKSVPVTTYLTNNSAKAVLFERSIEIKDLESKVKYLQNKIKDFEKENKTLYDIQSKQEKELKKFKEGVADIPSLLKSHKEETKVLESTVATVRKELRDCQKEVKIKNETILKKVHQIEKLNTSLRLHDKSVQDLSNELKELKKTKIELETESRKLLEANENFKFENGDLQDKIKEMVYRILNLEENLVEEKNLNKQQKRDNEQLQLKFEELKNETGIFPDKVVGLNSVAEDSSQYFAPGLSQTYLESESRGLKQVPVMLESQEKAFDGNSVNKVKEALLHTFKRYQDMCMSGSSNRSITPLTSTSSHLKPLPPLKGLRKNSLFLNRVSKDRCASSVDKTLLHRDSNLEYKGGEFSKESPSPLTVHGTTAEISKHARTSTENDLVISDSKQSGRASVKQCSVSQFPVSWFNEV